ncbi:MAG: chemotaxis protein CheW [Methylococcales bacterium]|nr:chemotaxis protein CheW [Methylococcales bacterium]
MIDLSLLEDFVMGAGESLEEMETALLGLESSPNNVELLNTIFRAIHTIKGAAQFVGLEKVSVLSHALEDLLDLLREGKIQATSDIVNVLIQANDRISTLVSDLERTQTENTEVDDLVQILHVHLAVPETNASTTEPATDDNNLNLFLEDETETDSFLLDPLADEPQTLDRFLEDDTDLESFLTTENDNDVALDDFLEENTEIDSFAVDNDDINTESSSFLLDIDDNTTENDPLDPLLFDTDETDVVPQASTPSHGIFTLPTEEHDQELFEIFILQLREKFALLNNNSIQLATNHAQKKYDLLTNTVELLESLKFSANYMAYEQLTYFYGDWIDHILNAQENLSKKQGVSLSFMQENLSKLQIIFPQLQAGMIKEAPPTEEGIPVDDTINETTIETSNNVNSLFELNEDDVDENAFIAELIIQNETPERPPPSPQTIEKAPKKNPSEIASDNSNESDIHFKIRNSPDESELFHKLSLALDASVVEQAIISEPINEVFSALLNSTEKQQQEIKETETKDLIFDVKTLKEVNEAVEIITPAPVEPKKPAPPKKPPSPNKKVAAEAIPEAPPKKVFKKSIRVDADKIDSLMNQVGELIVDRAYFFQLVSEISELQQYLKAAGLVQKDLKLIRTFAYRFSEAILALGRTSNALQESVMKVRMLPMTQLFNRFPRLVHDVANTNNKKVFLKVLGEDTELDKMIIEEISDPLMHMIRNAIGHGIEPPEERLKVGKPEIGNIVLEAYHESNHIVIEITDDGCGIDIERIKDKAEKIDLFTREELDRMSSNDLTRFIMMPGFSTAQEISSTSGRGVGMDVVKKNIEKLNGTIDIESKKGIETKMRLKIPLTLAIIPALIVKVGKDSFTIPLANVEETLRVQYNDISIMEDTEVMYLRGKTVPIFRLATLFSLTTDKKMDDKGFFVVIVNTGTQKIGLMVDSLIGQDEVVIKPLADYLYEQNCFSGATIIGDGRVSLIIDIYELVAMTTTKQINKHQRQEKKSLELFIEE